MLGHGENSLYKVWLVWLNGWDENRKGQNGMVEGAWCFAAGFGDGGGGRFGRFGFIRADGGA